MPVMKLKRYRSNIVANEKGQRVVDTTIFSIIEDRMGEVLIKKTVSGPGRKDWVEHMWFPNFIAAKIMNS